jgi:membrane-bound metal-dependent hydrolase YbcI (DUF457 family)
MAAKPVPFTPFHLGPGMLFKGIGGEHFSFMVFGGSQALMDIEPAYRMIVLDPVVHGLSHTIAGATLIGLIATGIGKPIGELVLRHLRFRRTVIPWTAAATGAFVGTFSHIVLDAMMHTDMMPWKPIAETNQMLGLVSVNVLHITCLLLGIIGALLFFAKRENN